MHRVRPVRKLPHPDGAKCGIARSPTRGILVLQFWLASRGLLMGVAVPMEAVVRLAGISLRLSPLYASRLIAMRNVNVETHTLKHVGSHRYVHVC